MGARMGGAYVQRLKVLAGAVLIVALAIMATFFWPYIGLAIAVLVPLGIIVSVIRSAIRDLRGERPDYTAGPIGFSDIPKKPKRIRHFVDEISDDE